MDWRRGALRIYRTLLYAYPAEFRREYGGEMEQFFTDRLAAEPAAPVWRQSVADILVSAPREHLHLLTADLRYSARLFARAPGFTLTAVLTMALGVGATTAVFTLLNAVLLRSLPYGEAEGLYYLWTPNIHFKPPVPQELGRPSPTTTRSCASGIRSLRSRCSTSRFSI
jgi:putative ABC transport system permease protein